MNFFLITDRQEYNDNVYASKNCTYIVRNMKNENQLSLTVEINSKKNSKLNYLQFKVHYLCSSYASCQLINKNVDMMCKDAISL